MLKVLHVISGDLWAGAEAMADGLLAELNADPNIELCAVALNEGKLADSLRARGIRTEILDEAQLASPRLLGELRRVAGAFRPAIVHTHRHKENVLGAVAARLVGARSIRTVHGWTEFPRLGYRLDKRLYHALDLGCGRWLQDRIVAVSEELEEKLAAHFDRASIVVIENGIDVTAVRAAASQPAGIRTDVTKKHIGIIARLVPVKRHDRFIDAAELLLREIADDVEFHIVGDGPLYAALATRIENSAFAARFHMHGFQNNVPALLSRLDGIVICSDHEGLPMNVLEARALGIPIVTTRLPSIQRLLEPEIAGIVCADESPQSIARAMAACSALPRVPVEEANWAFSSQRMARKYAELYHAVVEKAGTGASRRLARR